MRRLIKIYIKEVGLENLDWINRTEDRDKFGAVVNTELVLGFP